MEKWKIDVENDRLKLATLIQSAPDPEENLDKCSSNILESRLVQVHKFQIDVNELKEKYINEYKKDDDDRKQIRDAFTQHALRNK